VTLVLVLVLVFVWVWQLICFAVLVVCGRICISLNHVFTQFHVNVFNVLALCWLVACNQ